jgi:hypothetical protein
MNSRRLPSGSPKVDAGPAPSGPAAVGWPDLDRNTAASQVRDRVLDWAIPLEAQVAVARCNWNLGDRIADRARPVDVELLAAESSCSRAVTAVDELGTEHTAVERVGHCPVRYVDHAVTELGADQALPGH